VKISAAYSLPCPPHGPSSGMRSPKRWRRSVFVELSARLDVGVGNFVPQHPSPNDAPNPLVTTGIAHLHYRLSVRRPVEAGVTLPPGIFGMKLNQDVLDRYDTDAEHPSIHGTYLAVNVLYATIFGESPEGLTYRPEGITQADGEFLQRVAWGAVTEDQAP